MIKNYTTSISVHKTMAEIHKLLAMKGALFILNEYVPDGNGKIMSVSFKLKVNDNLVAFRLPAKEQGVYTIMFGGKRVANVEKAREQAARTTWRIIKDWIAAQIALVEADCAELSEVFLPYALVAHDTTMYEAAKNNGMKLLT